MKTLLQTHVSPFWRTHYTFTGKKSERATQKDLSSAYFDILVINTIAPMLFAYGTHKQDDDLTDRLLLLMENIAPERNSIITYWKEAGIECMNAGDSQAILQLHQHYCLASNCLRCRFGHEYIQHTPDMLRERAN